MFTVLKSKEFDLKHLHLKKKISVNENSYNIFISYMEHPKELIIQTPIMITPFGISLFGNNKYIDLSFINKNNDEEINLFYEKISEINNHVLKHMRYKHKYFKKNFINSIKSSSGIYPERIRVSISDKIKCYDKYNNIDNLDNLNSRTLVKALIHVSHIWINNGKFGIYWNIVQLKTYGKLILEEFNFLEEDQPSYTIKIPKINNGELERGGTMNVPPPPPPLPPPPPAPLINPIYEKYFKMLKMGISSEAVKQKILMDNLDPSIIDNNPSCDVICNASVQTRPPANNVNLLSEITKGVTLKSKNKRKYKLIPKKENKSVLSVPSLWEIKNKLSSLKKTNIKLK